VPLLATSGSTPEGARRARRACRSAYAYRCIG